MNTGSISMVTRLLPPGPSRRSLGGIWLVFCLGPPQGDSDILMVKSLQTKPFWALPSLLQGTVCQMPLLFSVRSIHWDLLSSQPWQSCPSGLLSKARSQLWGRLYKAGEVFVSRWQILSAKAKSCELGICGWQANYGRSNKGGNSHQDMMEKML